MPDSAVPTQATAGQLLVHVQQMCNSHSTQSQKLSSAAQQLEAYSESCAEATAALEAAMASSDCTAGEQQTGSKLTSTQTLLQVAASAAAALHEHTARLARTQSQLEQVRQELSEAQAQGTAAEAGLSESLRQLATVTQQREAAEKVVHQVRQDLLL